MEGKKIYKKIIGKKLLSEGRNGGQCGRNVNEYECLNCGNLTYATNLKVLYHKCGVCLNDPNWTPYTDKSGEIWKDVKGFEGKYWVSNYGNIKSIKGIRRPGLMTSGYLFVPMKGETRYKNVSVHRSVAIAFIPNPENKPHVNHIDGIRLNNHVSNLEWVTALENIEHSRNILGKTRDGLSHPLSVQIKRTAADGSIQYFATKKDAILSVGSSVKGSGKTMTAAIRTGRLYKGHSWCIVTTEEYLNSSYKC